MAEVIAEGLVVIKAKQDVEREIAKAKAAFDQAMRDMDRKRATMILDANLAPFQKKVEDAERKIAEYKKKAEDDAELGLDTTAADRNLKRWERELAKRRSARDELSLDTEKARRQLAQLQKLEDSRAAARKKYQDAEIKGSQAIADARQKEADSAVKATAKEVAAAKKAADDKAKAAASAAAAAEKAAAREAAAAEKAAKRAADAAEKGREREAKAAEKAAARAAAAAEKAEARAAAAREKAAEQAEIAHQREVDAIPTMNRQYAELERRIQRLNRERAKLSSDPSQRVFVNLQIEEAVAKMERLKERLNEVGREPPVEVVVVPGQEFGLHMRDRFHAVARDRNVLHAADAVAVGIGARFGQGIVRGMEGRNSAIVRGVVGMFAKLGHGISTMTVRIGPFTATIRQALIGLSLLGPTVLDIVGALGSLVGVVGSATLGVGALGAAFLGGAVPAALGMGLVIKDVAQEFTAAKKATKAYDDAVMKHGEGSKQAAKKLKELRNVMGAVSETTAKQFVEGQKLGKTWDRLTKPAHAAVWKMIGNSMDTAGKMMPMFARNTNNAMSEVEASTSKWMKALSSPAGQTVLDTMMTHFTASIGPLMSGLGNLVAYFGKVGAAASKHLKPLADTFDQWAQRLNKSADAGDAFQRKIDNVVQSAKDVGNFFLASGRFLKAFFGAGVKDGQSFVRTMTNGLDRWTAKLNTATGRANLQAFFKESVAGAKALWNALAPVVSTFVQWAAMIAPFARAFLQAASAVGQFVAAILKATALQGPLTALAATLGVLWGVSKISAATRAVGGFAKALFGVSAAQTAVAASASRAAAAQTASAAASTRAAGMGTAAAVATGAAAARATRVTGAGPVGTTTAAAAAAAAAAAKAAPPVGRLAKVGGFATKALRGLGLATLGISNPLAGAAVLAGAAGFAIYKFANRTKDYQKAATVATKATQNYSIASQQMGDIQTQLAQDYLSTKSAALQVKDAEKAVAALRKQGEQGTDEYKQAVMDLRQAEINLASSRNQAAATTRTEIANYRKIGSEAKTALSAAQKYSKGLGDQGRNREGFERFSELARKAGVSLKTYLDGAKNMLSNQKKGILDYAASLDQVAAAQNRVKRAQELSNLAVINHQRSLRGMAAIANNAAGHFASISRHSKGLARTISLKYTDAGSAAKVARSAAAAIKGGVPTRVVTNVIANTKTAEGAIARLRGKLAAVESKRVTAYLGATDQASAKIARIVERINGIKDKDARVKARAEGIEEIARLIAKIKGVPNKSVRAIARAIGTGDVQAMRAAIDSLYSKTVTTTVRTVYTSTGPQGLPGRSSRVVRPAKGQAPAARPVNALIGEGRDDEYRVNTRTGAVSKTNGPELTRLSRDEAIIPVETRYRQRGRDIFTQAAERLGARVTGTDRPAASGALEQIAKKLGLRAYAKGTPPKRRVGFQTEKGIKGEYDPNPKIPRVPTYKPKKKGKNVGYTSKKGWGIYIENLQNQRQEWEREVAFREMKVKEPEAKTIISGYNTVKDPATGEETKVPIYETNVEGINAWKSQLRDVMAAMDTLMSIVRQLVAVIPQAMAAARQERIYRTGAADKLDDQISREKKRKKPNQAMIDSKEKQRDNHRSIVDQLKTDEKQLGRDRVDAGFSLKEVAYARSELQSEHDLAMGDADKERDAANAESAKEIASITKDSGGGGGGGGGGDGVTGSDRPLSYGEQSMIRDTERANMLREHGGNAYQTSPGSPGGPGAGGGGMMSNASSRGYMMGPTSGGGGMTNTIAQGGFKEPAQYGRAGSGSAPDGGGGGKTVNITNNFQTQPDDPHLWSQGMAFEANSAF